MPRAAIKDIVLESFSRVPLEGRTAGIVDRWAIVDRVLIGFAGEIVRRQRRMTATHAVAQLCRNAARILLHPHLPHSNGAQQPEGAIKVSGFGVRKTAHPTNLKHPDPFMDLVRFHTCIASGLHTSLIHKGGRVRAC